MLCIPETDLKTQDLMSMDKGKPFRRCLMKLPILERTKTEPGRTSWFSVPGMSFHPLYLSI